MAGVFVQRLGAPEGVARRFLVYCMVGGFAALALAGVAAIWVTARATEHARSVNHTYEVELAILRAQVLIEQTETSRRGYVMTGMHYYLDNERGTAAKIAPAFDALTRLTSDNPRQAARVAAFITAPTR